MSIVPLRRDVFSARTAVLSDLNMTPEDSPSCLVCIRIVFTYEFHSTQCCVQKGGFLCDNCSSSSTCFLTCLLESSCGPAHLDGERRRGASSSLPPQMVVRREVKEWTEPTQTTPRGARSHTLNLPIIRRSCKGFSALEVYGSNAGQRGRAGIHAQGTGGVDCVSFAT